MANTHVSRELARAAAFLVLIIGATSSAAPPATGAPAAPAAAPVPAAPPVPTVPTVAPPPATQAVPAAWHATVRDFAAKHFKNPAWGYSHCMRDYALARELAAADHVTLDDDVLFAAAYLHDMAAFPPWEKEKLDHSDVAAGLIDTVLKGTGFPMAKIDAVRAAIRTHMYYRDPAAPEALYLHDADALDWLGAIGVARIMALVDANGGEPDGPKAAKMLEDNLERVPRRVLSPAGRAQVAPRKAELEQFLKDLRRETENLRTL